MTTLPLLKAKTLAHVPHGFTTRAGGVSPAPFDSLNLGSNTDDAKAHVQENRARVCNALGCLPEAWRSVRQVHGNRVHLADDSLTESPEADGLITHHAEHLLAILTADCVPILFASNDGAWVGAVHAGWRGTAARIAEVAIDAFKAHGLDPKHIKAAIGPAIGPCCFEISNEVRQALIDGVGVGRDDNSTYFRAHPKDASKSYANLWGLNNASIRRAGLPPENIEALEWCTFCDERFFSHRRDAGRTGRQGATICPTATQKTVSCSPG